MFYAMALPSRPSKDQLCAGPSDLLAIGAKFGVAAQTIPRRKLKLEISALAAIRSRALREGLAYECSQRSEIVADSIQLKGFMNHDWPRGRGSGRGQIAVQMLSVSHPRDEKSRLISVLEVISQSRLNSLVSEMKG